MKHESIIVPNAWLELDPADLRGVLLVIGAPDTGKTTFAHWLSDRLAALGGLTAFLDGDIGQSVLGPPTTVTLALPNQNSPQAVHADWPVSRGSHHLTHWFVGDVSPRGHMLPLVVGAGRLTRRAQEAGAETIVVDTTGLVDRAQGGTALKHALVDLLQPTTLVAFRRADELEPILTPLRSLSHPRVVELPVIDAVRQRAVPARKAHRAKLFRRYFAGAGVLHLALRKQAVFGGGRLSPRRLLALRDAAGFTLALGVVMRSDADGDELIVRTPLTDASAVDSVELGAICVDTATGCDFRVGSGT
jgi:polynucleotide 5'-hydroxyl-kinase GRC3/NOL9